jgi:hypothetical protein
MQVLNVRGAKTLQVRQNGVPHSHADFQSANSSFPPAVKAIMETMARCGSKPRQILGALYQNGHTKWTLAQVQGWVGRWHDKRRALPQQLSNTWAGVAKICADNALHIVMNTEDATEHDAGIAGHFLDEQGDVFAVVITTPKLAKNICNASKMVAGGEVGGDNIHNFCCNGSHLMTMTTRDANGKIHTVGFAAVSGETTSCVEKTCTIVKDFNEKTYGPGLPPDPKFTQADGSNAVANGMGNVFPDAKRLTCFTHIMNGLKKKHGILPKLQDKSLTPWLTSTIQALGAITHLEVFEALLVELEQVLRSIQEPAAADHLRDHMSHGRDGSWAWAHGAPGVSRTNNGCERLHRSVREYFDYDRKPLPDAIIKLLGLAKERSIHEGRFAYECEVGLGTWEKVPELAHDMKLHELAYAHGSHRVIVPSAATIRKVDATIVAEGGVVDTKSRRSILYRMAQRFKSMLSNPSRLVEKEMCEARRTDRVIEGYNNLLATPQSFYVLSPLALEKRPNKFVMFQCTCPQFWHHLHCKHALAYAVGQRLLSIPPEFSLAQIKRRKVGGRPKKAKDCYTRIDE